MSIHTRGRPKLPPHQAARVRAGLKALKARHGTDKATAEALCKLVPFTVSRVTVGAVLRGATGPSRDVATAVAHALSMTEDKLYSLTVAEIATRGAS